MKDAEYFVGKPVTSLQTMLRVLAEYDSSLPSVVPDGIYGRDTMRAVNEFQRRSGLLPTGVVDDETWTALYAAYVPANIQLQQAEPLALILDKKQVFLKGSRNRHVLLIQALMAVLQTLYPTMPEVRLSGVFDDATEAAVRWLQRVAGLPQSGILDKQLWQLLVGLYRMRIGTGEETENT